MTRSLVDYLLVRSGMEGRKSKGRSATSTSVTALLKLNARLTPRWSGSIGQFLGSWASCAEIEHSCAMDGE